MTARVVPVSLVTAYARGLLAADPLLQDLWMEGEVSQTFVSRGGHVYFSLKDEGSMLKCVLFRQHAMRQPALPVAGERLAVHGVVGVYEKDSALHATVDVIQPAGVGLYALQFERLRQKLEAEGLFDPTRKRALPYAPRVVGIVTSAEGSVWHDIQTVLRRRYPMTHLVLSPTSVQGPAAPGALVAAMQRLIDDGRSEVIVIARGGGSAEDLSCFNDEGLVRMAFSSPIPIVSAIGHETDWTLLDFVADVRAATPSAAAELVSPSVDEWRHSIARHRLALWHEVENAISREREMIRRASVYFDPSRLTKQFVVLRSEHRLARVKLKRAAEASVSQRRPTIDANLRLMSLATRAQLNQRRQLATAATALLGALDPQSVLGRGYAILHPVADWCPIESAKDVQPDDSVIAQLSDGSLRVRVQAVSHRSLVHEVAS